MRRVINSTYITLDGSIGNPQDWPSGRHRTTAAVQELQTELLMRCDALLLGRRTYEGFERVEGDVRRPVLGPHQRHGAPVHARHGHRERPSLLPRARRSLQLVDATALPSGNVVLTYRVA